MRYPYSVKIDGVFYPAGVEIPAPAGTQTPPSDEPVEEEKPKKGGRKKTEQ